MQTADLAIHWNPQETQPGLEDGYVWLMKNSNQQVEVA